MKSFRHPEENQSVSNIENNELLRDAYNFVPGQEILYRSAGGEDRPEKTSTWEVKVDIFNNTYLSCKETGAKAYFKNEGDIFYFTHFEGDRKALLYHFFLANYRVIFGFYRNLQLEDDFPLHVIGRKWGWIQDFAAPFLIFTRAAFSLNYLKMNDHLTEPGMSLISEANVTGPFGKSFSMRYNLIFRHDQLEEFIINKEGNTSEKWNLVKDI
jgi:hypothetical protein